MTHLYTLLVGGTVIPGVGPDAEAIAWAGDTILAVGTERAVRAISRGDSHVVDLGGAFVVPLATADTIQAVGGALEVGAPADLAVVDQDPRRGGSASSAAPVTTVAVVRAGIVVKGALPGLEAHDAHEGHT
jgi:predicted amidohydrolase YtcJ